MSANNQLVALVERIERVQEEMDGLAEDKKEIIAEAKVAGYDTKILRKVLARRKMDAKDRDEMDSLIETYEDALTGH